METALQPALRAAPVAGHSIGVLKLVKKAHGSTAEHLFAFFVVSGVVLCTLGMHSRAVNTNQQENKTANKKQPNIREQNLFQKQFTKNMMRFILISLIYLHVGSNVYADSPPLWDRLGGESAIQPWLASVVDFHFDDPLTAPYFGPHKFDNEGSRKYVKKQVLEFFSAGTGGPYKYSGKNMLLSSS